MSPDPKRWPLGVAAHIAVTEAYQSTRPEAVAAMAAKTKSLIGPQTSLADRVMFAQISIFRGAWDEVIFALNGYLDTERPSEPLAWLAQSFANAQSRPITSAFFRSLSAQVMALPRYARLAGAAEHNRGDLKAAEGHLRSALAADPRDLRALLLLASAIMRDNRDVEAHRLLSEIDDEKIDGSPQDFMRLAHHHRRAGEAERALRLAYRIAATHRGNEKVVASYPALVLEDEGLPASVTQSGSVKTDFWFGLEGIDGVHDVAGVIDTREIVGVSTFQPDHPLAAALGSGPIDWTAKI